MSRKLLFALFVVGGRCRVGLCAGNCTGRGPSRYRPAASSKRLRHPARKSS